MAPQTATLSGTVIDSTCAMVQNAAITLRYTGSSEVRQANTDASGHSTSGLFLGIDALREFNVLTNTYNVAYGKRPGAQVLPLANIGDNAFHGSAYECLRNNVMDARNYFDQRAVPEFQRNQFREQQVGPLGQNRRFLLGNYEGFRQPLDLSGVTPVLNNNARKSCCFR